jgi:hypothetical protein
MDASACHTGIHAFIPMPALPPHFPMTQGVLHKLVVSGKGEWRYCDILPAEAGKLQALEYARTVLGFSQDQTVAAGDSGNDIDMLDGQHFSVVVGECGSSLPDFLPTCKCCMTNERRVEGPFVHGKSVHLTFCACGMVQAMRSPTCCGGCSSDEAVGEWGVTARTGRGRGRGRGSLLLSVLERWASWKACSAWGSGDDGMVTSTQMGGEE